MSLPEEWMGHLVTGEEDMRGLEETSAKHVAQSVIFFVEGENGR